MPGINNAIGNILSGGQFWVYTDGSAVTQGERFGSYAAMILKPDGTREVVAGAANWTSIDRMELLAINEALYYIRTIALKGVTMGASIQVICDRENIVKSAAGVYGRNANADLWAQFDQISGGLKLSITHMSRNDEPPQAQADAICGIIRAAFSSTMQEIRANPHFQNVSLTRDTAETSWTPELFVRQPDGSRVAVLEVGEEKARRLFDAVMEQLAAKRKPITNASTTL